MSNVIPSASSWACLLDYWQKQIRNWNLIMIRVREVCSTDPNVVLCLPQDGSAWIASPSSHSATAADGSSGWCLRSIGGSTPCRTDSFGRLLGCQHRHCQGWLPFRHRQLGFLTALRGQLLDFRPSFLHQLCHYKKTRLRAWKTRKGC